MIQNELSEVVFSTGEVLARQPTPYPPKLTKEEYKAGIRYPQPEDQWSWDNQVSEFVKSVYPDIKVYDAVDLNETARRMTKSEVTFFTPWGPTYRGDSSIQPVDIKTVEYIAGLFSMFREELQGKKVNWLILAADEYGVMNGVPQVAVEQYFSELKCALEAKDNFSFVRWSEIRPLASRFVPDLTQLPAAIVERASVTATKMGGASPEKYLQERLREASYLEYMLKPIKVSLAPPNKDLGVDGSMPRLYVVPDALQTPWLLKAGTGDE